MKFQGGQIGRGRSRSESPGGVKGRKGDDQHPRLNIKNMTREARRTSRGESPNFKKYMRKEPAVHPSGDEGLLITATGRKQKSLTNTQTEEMREMSRKKP